MPSKAWKRTQREHAQRLGGRSSADRGVPSSVEDSIGAAGGMIIAESKHGYSKPKYLEEWMQQAEGYARRKKDQNPIPVVIWHTPRKHVKNDLVFMRFRDFRYLVERAFGPEAVISDGLADEISGSLEGEHPGTQEGEDSPATQ